MLQLLSLLAAAASSTHGCDVRPCTLVLAICASNIVADRLQRAGAGGDTGTLVYFSDPTNGPEDKNLGVYQASDVFQISVNADGKIEFRMNGLIVRTSTVAPSFPLVIDTSFSGAATQTGLNSVSYLRKSIPLDDPTWYDSTCCGSVHDGTATWGQDFDCSSCTEPVWEGTTWGSGVDFCIGQGLE